VAHFREFRAALDRKDLPAAEAAATAALQASEATQGRRTAVLALNLATLRLTTGDPARALEPATRAYELATSSSESGVDPLHASLILGRAELAAGERSGAERLRQAIAAGEAAGVLPVEGHDAAVALGQWALGREDAELAQAAWSAAGRLAEHSGTEPNFNKGRARLFEGAAIFMDGVDAQQGRGVASLAAHAAFHAFGDAVHLFEPYAFPEQPSETLTAAQRYYAEALGWLMALNAKIKSQNQRWETSLDLDALLSADAEKKYCRLGMLAEPRPRYPRELLNKGGVGAVVLHVSLDGEGRIVKRQIAAVVPQGRLHDAVEAVYQQWRFQRSPTSAPDCRVRSSNYLPLQFVLE
jgi:hypothetical protein